MVGRVYARDSPEVAQGEMFEIKAREVELLWVHHTTLPMYFGRWIDIRSI